MYITVTFDYTILVIVAFTDLTTDPSVYLT